MKCKESSYGYLDSLALPFIYGWENSRAEEMNAIERYLWLNCFFREEQENTLYNVKIELSHQHASWLDKEGKECQC